MADVIMYEWYNHSAEKRFEGLRDLVYSLEFQDAFKKANVSFDDLLDVSNKLYYASTNKFDPIKDFFKTHKVVEGSIKNLTKLLNKRCENMLSEIEVNKYIQKLHKKGSLIVTPIGKGKSAEYIWIPKDLRGKMDDEYKWRTRYHEATGQ